jgi:hypothetical protein
MCQSKANGGKRCHPQPGHALFAPAGLTRLGLNDTSDVSQKVLEELHKEGLAWRANLTEDEEDEILRYQQTGYLVVNPYLRGQEVEEGYDRIAQKYIEHLDSALSKAPQSPVDRILYRSIYLPTAQRVEGTTKKQQLNDYLDDNFVPGETVEFPEYLSTSVDSDLVVRSDQKKRKKGFHAVLEIVSKSGAVLHKEGRRGSYGVQDDEKEILLPRGMKFKVVKVYRDVTFESTYRQGVDNSGMSHERLREPGPRIRSHVPVIQLMEIED